MIDDAPRLSRHDIQAQLEKLLQAERNHYLFAFYGTGEPERLKTPRGDFDVVPVRSELELRERMPPLDDGDARMAFLVPWPREVPLDLRSRFARQGRVFRIGKDARLMRLFGVTQLDPSAQRSALGDWLLRPRSDGPGGAYGVPATKLTAALMWRTWLSVDWGVPTGGGLELDRLLGWAALDGRGGTFAPALGPGAGEDVRRDLLAHLDAELGPAGPVAWRAWEAGAGERLLAFAVVCEALASSEDAAVRMWLKTKLQAFASLGPDAPVDRVLRDLADAVDAALRHVTRQSGDDRARFVVQQADGLLDDPEVRVAAAPSRRLPSAWAQRLHALDAALTAGATTPGGAAVDAAVAALRTLETHERFQHASERPRLEAAEMGVRLLSWLVARPDRSMPAPEPAWGEVVRLGRWYAEEGGYVDWARRGVRALPADGPLGAGAGAVLARVDAERTDMDRRFAEGLRAWCDAGKPSHEVLPIDRAVEKLAVKLLDDDPERRLLVVLMDGMAWAQAVELLRSMGTLAQPWAPLRWHRMAAGKIGQGAYPVVLAGLPTTTEISRSAFFRGKPTAPGKAPSTGDDPKRWAENTRVAKYFEGLAVPKLMLKAESHDVAGTAAQPALTMIGDASQRVVAVVVNAIDDSLKGTAAVHHPWNVETIKSLGALLDRAREAKRAVLFASDHGHVPADRMAYAQPATTDGGARWRPWAKVSDPVEDWEVAFKATHTWAPKGSEGVVLIADDAHRYISQQHAGEHGGATLAEVVAPCVLLGSRELADERPDDTAQQLTDVHAPTWWFLGNEVVPAASRPPAGPAESKPAPSRKPSRKPAAPEAQLQIPGTAPKPPPAPPTPGECQPWVERFAVSKVLEAQVPKKSTRSTVIAAVSVLADANGMLSAEAFGTALGEPPFRIPGLVSLLQEALNVDGYSVLRMDPDAQTVQLDVVQLQQHFLEDG